MYSIQENCVQIKSYFPGELHYNGKEGIYNFLKKESQKTNIFGQKVRN